MNTLYHERELSMSTLLTMRFQMTMVRGEVSLPSIHLPQLLLSE